MDVTSVGEQTLRTVDTTYFPYFHYSCSQE